MEMQDMNSNTKPPHPKSIIELFDSHDEFAGYLNGKSDEFINGSHEVRGYHIRKFMLLKSQSFLPMINHCNVE